MSDRSIKVKIVKENAKTVIIKMVSLNRNMPVPKKEFDQRVASGLYEVVDQPALTTEEGE